MGTDIGVYAGFMYPEDWMLIRAEQRKQFSALEAHGAGASALCGRVSYVLGLKGPCQAINTACSSSLVALDSAVNSMRAGKCVDGALVAGVNLMMHPAGWIGMGAVKAHAPDGRSKTFDASADGFGRGEACGAVVVQVEEEKHSVRLQNI